MKILTAFGTIKAAPDAIAVFLFEDEVRSPNFPALNRATVSEIGRSDNGLEVRGEEGRIGVSLQ